MKRDKAAAAAKGSREWRSWRETRRQRHHDHLAILGISAQSLRSKNPYSFQLSGEQYSAYRNEALSFDLTHFLNRSRKSKYLRSAYFPIEISIFSSPVYWNLYFLSTFLLKSLLLFTFLLKSQLSHSLVDWNLYFLIYFSICIVYTFLMKSLLFHHFSIEIFSSPTGQCHHHPTFTRRFAICNCFPQLYGTTSATQRHHHSNAIKHLASAQRRFWICNCFPHNTLHLFGPLAARSTPLQSALRHAL